MSDQSKFLYIPGKNLQELFRDKAGLPLREGQVFFYKDDARSDPKPVFKRTGDPITPFVALENPLQLGIAGSPVDEDGADVAFYYYPYDANGNVELYYVEVYDSEGVKQFTREAWPEEINTSQTSDFSFVDNYIPNGQFITHLDVGTLQNQLTNLALGNWAFILSNGFSSINSVTFERYGSFVTNPEATPQYAIRVQCTNPNPVELRKDLAVIFKDANFLAGQSVTFQMSALTNNGVPLNLELIIEKVYGSGGSPTEEISITTFTIQPNDAQKYLFAFTVPDNEGKSTGVNSELRLMLRASTSAAFDYSATNFQWVLGTFDILTFPPTSPNQEIMQAVAGSVVVPATDGSDQGAALILDTDPNTPASSINPLLALRFASILPSGSIIMYGAPFAPTGWVFCDGNSYDIVGSNSTPGYVRLYGTIGNYHGIGFNSFFTTHPSSGKVQHQCASLGSASAPDAHTSGFTIAITSLGTSISRQIVQTTCLQASLINPGSYFELFAPSGKSTVYWFSIDGLGNDPSGLFPTSLVKEIPLINSDTADQVATKIIANFATQVKVPDFRNMAPKGWNDTRGDVFSDPDRFSRIYPDSITLSGTSAPWAGGATSHTFAATGLTNSFITTADIATSTNNVKVIGSYAGTDTVTVLFSADPGANTSVNWHGTDFSSNVVGNVVGSVQMDAYQEHTHNPTNLNQRFSMREIGAGVAGVNSDGGYPSIPDTGPTTAGQGYRSSSVTRDKNIYVPFIIKL